VSLAPQKYVAPTPRPIAAMRWGRGEGCNFVTQSAGQWPERYICKVNQQFGCSYDNR
jgi:hypothetical protein